MNGSFLRFYVLEKQTVHHVPVWEWLLERANKMGIRGGSAFRAIAWVAGLNFAYFFVEFLVARQYGPSCWSGLASC